VIDALDEMLAPHIFPPRADGVDPRRCATCGTGRLSLKLGKFGAFIGCSNYPECKYTRPFSVPGADGAEETATRPLGRDPHGVEVTLRNGRFGPYVQLGEAVEGEKPKRASLLRGMNPADIDLETALKLLSLPREVGRHPEDGQPIMANAGRYGPYVQHGKTYANVESGDDVFNIGLNRAVTLIAEKLAKGPRARFGGDPGRSLGDHPDKGGPVLVKNGRYGPYVTHDGIHATLPSDKTPETITLEEALGLIAARAERTGGGKRAAGKGAKKGAKAETAKPKKAKGKAKAADAGDEVRESSDAAGAPAAASAKPKQPTSTARAKTAKKPARPKPAAKPTAEQAPKRAKAGK
jgi:DNA topoisomerase-1